MSSKSSPVREPPIELKAIKPYILRGNQLRGADPVITYYCYFWAIKYILANGLHTQSPECTVWTTDLMDELERRKSALEGNELLTDDMAAQAYVENFALKIFNNGAQVVDANKATSQTSDTLLAGATLLEVCRVFGDLDTETLQKIKFGKFHAARIWKEIQAGRDPNPPKPAAPEPEQRAEPPPQVYSDASGKQFNEPPPDIYGTHNEPPPDIYNNASRPPAPTIEEVPDDSELSPHLARTSLHSTPATTPLDLPSPPRSPTGDTYTPEVPTVHEPSAPSLFPTTMGSANTILPDVSPYAPPPPPQIPQAPYTPQAPQAPSYYAPQPQVPQKPYTRQAPGASQGLPQVPSYGQHYVHQAPTPPTPVPQQKKVKKEVSPEDITLAQKHARWAISALDYEDIDTAIKQFRLGLELLGAGE